MARNKTRPKRSRPTITSAKVGGHVGDMLAKIKHDGVEERLLKQVAKHARRARNIDPSDADAMQKFNRAYQRTMLLIGAFGLQSKASAIYKEAFEDE